MRLYYEIKKCLACKSCEIACALSHSKAKDIFSLIRDKTAKPAIKVVEFKTQSYPLSCRHCKEHPCVDACMAGALEYEESKKLILYDKDRCVGCWMCIMVCPYGVIRREKSTKVPIRCDGCVGKDIPSCVKACPTQAIKQKDSFS